MSFEFYAKAHELTSAGLPFATAFVSAGRKADFRQTR